MTNRWNFLAAAVLGVAVVFSQAATQAQVRPKAKAKEPPRVTQKPVTPNPAPDAKDVKDAAKDAKDAAKDRAKDARDDAKDAAKDRAKDARDDRAKDARDDAKDRAKDARDDAKDAAKDRAKNAKNDVKDRANDAKAARKFDASNVKVDDLGLAFKEADKGITVSNVDKNSVFVNSGLRSGDQIVSINGQNVVRQNDFVRYLFASGVTGRVPVIVMRGGAQQTVYMRPTTIIRDYERVVVDDRRDPIRDFGLVLDNRYHDRLLVDRVVKDSRADRAGIKVDDEILAVNDRDVESRTELARVLEKYEGEQVDMEVRRDRAAQVIEVKTIR